MDIVSIVVLALVQGLTEFLPISSSAHLILTPLVLGSPDQGLAFDVAVHLGSLVAVIVYFRNEIWTMLRDFFPTLIGRPATPDARLAWYVILGTIPVGVAGLAFKGTVETHLRSDIVIALATIGFGALLWYADSSGRRSRDERDLGWRDALVIGLFQALALIPGTSRSGITMTAGLLLGLSRRAASRFSFLLAIPAITLSGMLVTFDLIRDPVPVAWGDLALGALLSGLAAYACIRLFLALIERISMLPFVIYRFILGAALLLFAYSS